MVVSKIDLDKVNVNPEGKGTFGFSNFAEVWNGRMAMIGFVSALVGEFLTGKGILAQVGISREGGILVALFLVGFTIAATIGYYTVKLSSPQSETNA
ncbi:MAG: chlorophyll a/b-binding protein [Pseudanabaenaceae cyanobacterium]